MIFPDKRWIQYPHVWSGILGNRLVSSSSTCLKYCVAQFIFKEYKTINSFLYIIPTYIIALFVSVSVKSKHNKTSEKTHYILTHDFMYPSNLFSMPGFVFLFLFCYSALSNIHPLYIQCFLHASWALVWFAFLLPICFATVIATFYCILWHNPFVVYIPKGVILFKEGKHEFCITYYLKDAIEFIYSFPIFQWILHCQIRLTFETIEYMKLKYFKNAIVTKKVKY